MFTKLVGCAMMLSLLVGCAGRMPVAARDSPEMDSVAGTEPFSLLSAFIREMDQTADAYIHDRISDQRVADPGGKETPVQPHWVSQTNLTIRGTPLAQYERDRTCYETEYGWRVRIAFARSGASARPLKHPFIARSGGFPSYFVLTIDPASNVVCNAYTEDM